MIVIKWNAAKFDNGTSRVRDDRWFGGVCELVLFTNRAVCQLFLCSWFILLTVCALLLCAPGRSIAFRGERGNDEPAIEMIKVSHLKWVHQPWQLYQFHCTAWKSSWHHRHSKKKKVFRVYRKICHSIKRKMLQNINSKWKSCECFCGWLCHFRIQSHFTINN